MRAEKSAVRGTLKHGRTQKWRPPDLSEIKRYTAADWATTIVGACRGAEADVSTGPRY